MVSIVATRALPQIPLSYLAPVRLSPWHTRRPLLQNPDRPAGRSQERDEVQHVGACAGAGGSTPQIEKRINENRGRPV